MGGVGAVQFQALFHHNKIGHAGSVLGFREEFMHIDMTPVAMTCASVFFAWGIFKYRLFDLLPLARSTTFDLMDDPVYILDTQARVVDCNPAACEFLDKEREEFINHSFTDLFTLPTNILAPENPSAFQRDIDPRFEALILKMLSK